MYANYLSLFLLPLLQTQERQQASKHNKNAPSTAMLRLFNRRSALQAHRIKVGIFPRNVSFSSSAPGFDFLTGNGKVVCTDGTVFATGIMGNLSESSVICRAGGSVVHAVVNSQRSDDPKEAFLPLTVDYRSRSYAFGKIPDLPQRRERHGTDDELLVARCIDRAVRPLFPKGYVNEVQLLVTTHAADGVHDPTIAAMNAASFALLQSRQPWFGPIGCVRIGIIDGVIKVNPTIVEMERSTLDLVYAGTKDRVLM
jgi:polyribonucleotide nucleotidyltransferase